MVVGLGELGQREDLADPTGELGEQHLDSGCETAGSVGVVDPGSLERAATLRPLVARKLEIHDRADHRAAQQPSSGQSGSASARIRSPSS